MIVTVVIGSSSASFFIFLIFCLFWYLKRNLEFPKRDKYISKSYEEKNIFMTIQHSGRVKTMRQQAIAVKALSYVLKQWSESIWKAHLLVTQFHTDIYMFPHEPLRLQMPWVGFVFNDKGKNYSVESPKTNCNNTLTYKYLTLS